MNHFIYWHFREEVSVECHTWQASTVHSVKPPEWEVTLSALSRMKNDGLVCSVMNTIYFGFCVGHFWTKIDDGGLKIQIEFNKKNVLTLLHCILIAALTQINSIFLKVPCVAFLLVVIHEKEDVDDRKADMELPDFSTRRIWPYIKSGMTLNRMKNKMD